MRLKPVKILSHLCRLILAATFIVSGFVKSVDPWGTAMKVDEYLSIYGMEQLSDLSMPFSIWMCGAELMMGLMLLFKVRIRLVSIFALLSMTFFTLLSLLSATWLPVEDCGCFGEALKLTPWQTFAKNVALLPMACVVWWRYRPDKILAFKPLEFVLMILFFSLSMSVGIYSYRHLPPVDFLPYKVGVNILEAMQRSDDEARAIPETVLVYRNKNNGKLREFSLTDKEWQNSDKWEWVDTYTKDDEPLMQPTVVEFSIRDVEGDATMEILQHKGKVYMFCMTHVGGVGLACHERFASAMRHAEQEGALSICLTSRPLHEVTYYRFGEHEARVYNVDASTLKTMLRANNGVVVLDNGTIVEKLNCNDIDF